MGLGYSQSHKSVCINWQACLCYLHNFLKEKNVNSSLYWLFHFETCWWQQGVKCLGCFKHNKLSSYNVSKLQRPQEAPHLTLLIPQKNKQRPGLRRGRSQGHVHSSISSCLTHTASSGVRGRQLSCDTSEDGKTENEEALSFSGSFCIINKTPQNTRAGEDLQGNLLTHLTIR